MSALLIVFICSFIREVFEELIIMANMEHIDVMLKVIVFTQGGGYIPYLMYFRSFVVEICVVENHYEG